MWYNRPMDSIAALRSWMDTNGLDAFIVPSSDPHQGEYVPEHYQVRAFISGFHGSAGTVVVTKNHAGLWTDSRYFLVAAHALEGSEFVLHRVHTPGTTDYPQWIAEELEEGASVGVDGRLVTTNWFNLVQTRLGTRGIDLVSTDDPFDALWRDRPPMPAEPVVILERHLSGESARSRLSRIQDEVKRQGARSHIISTLDDIAWTLNLRGNDIEYNPVFVAFLVISSDETDSVLYTDQARLSSAVLEALGSASVTVRDYDDFSRDLRELPGPILLDPDRTSYAITCAAGDRFRPCEIQPSTAFKARKNPTEIRNLKNAMERDGVAMVRFLAWLHRTVEAGGGGVTVDEHALAEKLQAFRRDAPEYLSDSFSSISSLGSNAAIVHYSVPREGSALLEIPTVYLIDSGAQYRDGTTDITRTVALDPTGGVELDRLFPELRRDFTLVLKGHIGMAQLIFPQGKPGREIDAVARLPLWRHFRNYGHGTGHGVGFVLNVHEGPQKIAPGGGDYPLEEGMLCSNEPGLYRAGQYGVRTENLVLVQSAPLQDQDSSDFGDFLQFETLTLCPIDHRLIDVSLMTREELDWINGYHLRVREALSEHLAREDQEWLAAATRPIGGSPAG